MFLGGWSFKVQRNPYNFLCSCVNFLSLKNLKFWRQEGFTIDKWASRACRSNLRSDCKFTVLLNPKFEITKMQTMFKAENVNSRFKDVFSCYNLAIAQQDDYYYLKQFLRQPNQLNSYQNDSAFEKELRTLRYQSSVSLSFLCVLSSDITRVVVNFSEKMRGHE